MYQANKRAKDDDDKLLISYLQVKISYFTKMPEEWERNKNICHEKSNVSHEVLIIQDLLGLAGLHEK